MIPKRYSIALAMRFMITPLILPVVAIKIAPGADLDTPNILKGNKIAQVIENKMWAMQDLNL